MSRNGGTPIAVSGNLTADPELRFTGTGVAVASFSVASTPRRYDKQTDKWVDQTPSFFRCVAWRDLAEHVAETLDKGSRVIVTGEIVTENWETDSGEKRSGFKLEVVDIGPSLQFATAKIAKMKRGRDADAPPPADPYTGEQATHRTRPTA